MDAYAGPQKTLLHRDRAAVILRRNVIMRTACDGLLLLAVVRRARLNRGWAVVMSRAGCDDLLLVARRSRRKEIWELLPCAQSRVKDARVDQAVQGGQQLTATHLCSQRQKGVGALHHLVDATVVQGTTRLFV